ncbi:TonB family protein [Psychromonas arctica]|uniref:TonB family protein n=1 Tax=Psychromonas arctica TaxID=168275 RepID=A0ABU9HF33_9GAMM
MKTSYHYFPFIVISLLLHYLFFYFNSNTSSENFPITQTYTSIKTADDIVVSSKLTSEKLIAMSLPQLNAIQSTSASTSLPLQQTTRTEPVKLSISKQKTNQVEIIASSTPQKMIQAEIIASSTTQQKTTQTEKMDPSITQQKIAQDEKMDPSITQQEIAQTKIVASTKPQEIAQIKQSESSFSLPEENERVKIEKVLPVKSYQVNVKTHTSSEVALLKEYTFERNLVNLPKIVISKPSKKNKVKKTSIKNATAKSTQPMTIMKNSEIRAKTKINKTNRQMTALDTRDFNNKTSTVVQYNSATTGKRIFKPKSDTTNTSMAKQGNLLPQAMAVSGKAPSYPKQAALQQQKGQVVVNMTVLPSGTTKEAEIIQSSGHEMLDKAVLNFIARELFMPSLEGQDRVPSKQSFFYSFE